MNETGNGSGGIRQSVTKIVVLKEVFLMLKNHHMNGLLCLCLMLAQTYYKNKKCSFFFFFGTLVLDSTFTYLCHYYMVWGKKAFVVNHIPT